MADREQFDKAIEDVEKLVSNDPEVKAIQADIAEADKVVKALINPTNDGWKLLNQEDKDNLTQKYGSALTKMNAYLKKEKNPNDPAAEEVRQTMSKMRGFFMEDLTEIRAYDPVKEPKSLATIFEDARSITLETNGMELGRWGAAMSTRIPMTILVDGKNVRGVFTEKKIYDPAGKMRKTLDDALKKVPAKKREAAGHILEKILQPAKDYLTPFPDLNDTEKGSGKANVLNFLHNVISTDKDGYEFIDRKKLINTLAQQNEMSTKDVQKILGSKALDQLVDTLYDGESLVNGLAGIPEGADITMRNVMMSRGADLFGVPEVIARSRPMKLRDGDKVVEGVFMEHAEGVDVNKPNTTTQRVDIDPLDGVTEDAFRQVADLGVLDFIFGNIDRHRANMFYKFDKQGKFAGVMGIDNDCSGGVMLPIMGKHHLPGLPDMMFISDTMAAKIKNVTPEQLAMTMHGIVEESAIESACERLEAIKNQICDLEAGRKKDAKDRGSKLVTMKKSEWGKSFFNKCIEAFTRDDRTNIFTKAIKSVKEIGRTNIRPLSKMPILGVVGNENRATLGGVFSQYAKADMILEELREVTKGNRTSPEFEAMRTAVEEYRDYTGDLIDRMRHSAYKVKEGSADLKDYQDQRVSSSDLRIMQKKMEKILETSNNYQINKLLKVGGFNKASGYEKKRIMVSDKIAEYANSWVKMKPDEEKQLDINKRRNNEDMLRLVKKQAEVNPEAPEGPQPQ